MLGFDAMDPEITEQMARNGELPALRELFASAARCPIRNPPGLYVGTLWSTFFTGRSAAETGFHCWEEIVPGGYERRLTTPASIRGEPFWEAISDAGRRVAVLDVPHCRAERPINGIQISEWGCHDRHFGLRTYPPELAQELVNQFGLHAVLGADPFSTREWAPDDYLFREEPLRSGEEDQALLEGLLAGAEAKRRLSASILADEDWDFFLNVFGEPHSVGHQLWHVHDPTHPRHDPAVRARIGDPLHRLYRVMDQAVGDALSQVDEQDTLLVLLSHGMGPQYNGLHLLPEILRRLDAADRSQTGRSIEGRTLGAAWAAMPGWLRPAAIKPLAALLRTRAARRQLRAPPAYDTEDQRRAQGFFTSPNNFAVGGVRINLVGRETEGRVTRGAQLDQLCRRLEADLLALVNVETGSPVIVGVERSDHHYDREPLDAIPDLFVTWNDEHPIETIWSPRFGLLRGQYTHWRTGDHRPGGLLLVRSPKTASRSELPALDIGRLGAVIADELGVVPSGAGEPNGEDGTAALKPLAARTQSP